MPSILKDDKIEYKVIDKERSWHFPQGKETITKAKEYADKGWTIVYNGKQINRRELNDIHCPDPYLHTMTAGTGSFKEVLEFADEENKVFYFKCVGWHAINLM